MLFKKTSNICEIIKNCITVGTDRVPDKIADYNH